MAVPSNEPDATVADVYVWSGSDVTDSRQSSFRIAGLSLGLENNG